MPTWIALLRGINVGGKNMLPMKDLLSDLQSLGLENVATYIQSGNAVFRSSKKKNSETLGTEIAAAIEKRHGFKPHVLVLNANQLKGAVEANPFREAEADPKSLHLFCLASTPVAVDFNALTERKSPSEQLLLSGRFLYLHAPDGIGRSKLAAAAERILGVTTTARNWRTVKKLLELANNV